MRRKKLYSVILAAAMLVSMTGCAGSSKSTEKETSAQKKAETSAETSTEAGTQDKAEADTQENAGTDENQTDAAEPITYKLYTHYSTDDEKIPVDYALEKLSEVMPNVTIEVEPQANDDGNTIKSRIAVGDVPDFFNVNINQLEIAKEAESIMELDDMLASTGLKDKYLPSVVDKQIYYKDGHCYALPTGSSQVDLLFYNKELFEQNGVKVPENYTEFLDAVKAFRDKGIDPIPTFAKESWPIGAYFDMFLQRVHPEGMLGLNNGLYKASDADVSDAIHKAADLIAAGCFQEGATTYDYDAARSMFETGKTPMFINGEWEISDATEALGDKCDFLDIFPTSDEKGKNDYAMPGAAEIGGLAISATVEEPEQAKQVAAYLVEFLAEGSYVKLGRIDSAFSTDNLTCEKELSPMTEKLLKQKENYSVPSTVTHALPNNEFSTGFGELLQQLVAGMDADEFIQNVDKLYEESNE